MRVEGKVLRVQQNVGQGGGVDVGEASQAPEKVSRVVVRPEQTAKVGVEDGLGVFPAHGHGQNQQINTNIHVARGPKKQCSDVPAIFSAGTRKAKHAETSLSLSIPIHFVG